MMRLGFRRRAALPLLAAVIGVACQSGGQSGGGNGAPLVARGQPGERCVVARIIDGDTFVCADSMRVRLTGVDTPERGQGSAYRQARDALAGWLATGSTVRLERDVEPADRYGRTLAYVWVGDTMVNEALVHDGWAVLLTIPPNVKYAERFQRAQRAGRQARAGLWATGGFECLPREARRGDC